MKNSVAGTGADLDAAKCAAGTAGFGPLRAWPAVLLVLLMLLARFGPPHFDGGLGRYWMISIFGPLLCCVLLIIWWLAASRARWKERLLGFLGLIGSLVAVLALADATMRGPATVYLTLPMGMAGFAAAAALFRRRPPQLRTSAALLVALGAFSYSALLRSRGMTGDYVLDTIWRWSPDPEQRLLAAKARNAPNLASRQETEIQTEAPAWAEFRGPDRAGRSSAPQIDANWTARPPRQLWKIAVGPGWSSFAVAAHSLYTQEQRGPMEAIVCYDADSGREIWRREFEARLEDPLGGPGPRATPTLADGALFAVGPTGILACLNPANGEIIWRRELTKAANRAVPMWGFAGSPLVTGGRVIVYAGGAGDKGLLAFDARTGDLRWAAPTGIDSYSSPQLSTVAGEKCVLMLSNDGLVLCNPVNGGIRFNYESKVSAYRALQPAVLENGTILLQTPMNNGTRAIQISQSAGKWAAEERWNSRDLKTDFSDLVTFEGHAYGNDGGFLVCLDLQTGSRKWKGVRYGKGQILLLERSRLLLVLTERGQVVLVPATPAAHSEAASFKALEGKTWNHPVLVNDRLYVRNSQEAAAYILPLASGSVAASR